MTLLGMLLVPWGSLEFCVAHPFGVGHEPHPHGPSPCELRDQYQGDDPAFMPPMECFKVAVDAGEYLSDEQYLPKREAQFRIGPPLTREPALVEIRPRTSYLHPPPWIPSFSREANKTRKPRGPPVS